MTWAGYQFGRTITAAQYQFCSANLQGLSRRVRWQQPYDAWITPVLATPPMKIGTVNLEETDLVKGWAPIINYVPFTALRTLAAAIEPAAPWSKSACRLAYRFVGKLGEKPFAASACGADRKRLTLEQEAAASRLTLPTGYSESGSSPPPRQRRAALELPQQQHGAALA